MALCVTWHRRQNADASKGEVKRPPLLSAGDDLVCPICGSEAKSKAGLTSHMRFKHASGE